jgi:hypothetical protein
MTHDLTKALTLAGLIHAYQTDPTSTYHGLRYHVRKNHESMLRRLSEQYGHTLLSDIRARDIKLWHMGWSEGGRLSVAKAFMSQLSTMSGFGLTMLEDTDCERLSLVLSKIRFPSPKPRKVRLTAQQAEAIRLVAHSFGWHSIALAQAFQFELMLRQKDCLGEYVPFTEPGESDIRFRGQKWLRGIRWEEVDANLILTHTTSKKQKDIKADLKLAPMICDELAFLGGRKASGPIIINEITGAPWSAAEFRRKWRIVAMRPASRKRSDRWTRGLAGSARHSRPVSIATRSGRAPLIAMCRRRKTTTAPTWICKIGRPS